MMDQASAVIFLELVFERRPVLTMLETVDQRKMNAVRAYFEWMPIR